MTRTTIVPLVGSIAIVTAAFTLLQAVCTTKGTWGYLIVGVIAVLASLVSPFVGGPEPRPPGRARVALRGATVCALVWLAGFFLTDFRMACPDF